MLCCGSGIYVVMQFKNSASKDPATIASVTKKIAEIEIPSTFTPTMSINIDFWFVPMMKMRMVVYQTKDKTGSLTLMEIVVTLIQRF